MNRRDFLTSSGTLGLAAAFGIPDFHSPFVEGDPVDVTFRWVHGATRLPGWKLFGDADWCHIGIKNDAGDRMQIPFGAAAMAIFLPIFPIQVRLEHVSARGGDRYFGDRASLYVDWAKDEFGIKPESGESGTVSVPCSSVQRLLGMVPWPR